MNNNCLMNFIAITLYWSLQCGAQDCTDVVDVYTSIEDTFTLDVSRQVIVPMSNFSCNGRITGYLIRVSVSFDSDDDQYPTIQVYHPTNQLSYTELHRYQLVEDDISRVVSIIYLANVSFTGSNRINFQSGDTIGYYLPSNLRHNVRNIQAMGYISYTDSRSNPRSTFSLISDTDSTVADRQPLIQVIFDIQCDNLTAPSNGEISSCSSGSIRVGYEGDTCSFTCNTGYELTGSDTRTCQSDGSWSGTETMCRRVNCSMLNDPINGTTTCSLGVDGVPSYEDTCSFTCNTGYELIGSETRTCQSDGSWSGTETMCRRVPCPSLTDPSNGILTCSLGDDGVPSYEDTCSFTCNTGYELTGSATRTCQIDESWSGSETMCNRVPCPSLAHPDNGTITCSLGDDGVPSYEDTCSFTCNTGYELTGSPQRTCQSDGSWSGSPVSCTIMECPSSSLPMNSMLAESCSNTYQSMCDLQCEEGFNGSGDPSFVCDVLNDGSVMWMTSGGGLNCERIQCNTSLSSPSNGEVSCNSTGVSRYEDQCSFSCDPGYELTGSSTRQCLSNESWSGVDVTCDILHCNNLTSTIENSILVNDCGCEFGSVCSLGCETGYRPVGNNMFTCDSVNVLVEWRNNVTREIFKCIGVGDSDDDSGGSAGAVVGGVLGGLLISLVIVVIVLLIMFHVRKSKRAYVVGVKSSYIYKCKSCSDDNNMRDEVSGTIVGKYQPPTVLSDYEDPDYSVTNKYSVVDQALSSLNRTQDTMVTSPAPYEIPLTMSRPTAGIYEMEDPSPYDMAESMEAEQQIYETPCENEEPAGPVYCKPPSDEHKIYEEFAGKKFRKIFHKEVMSLEELGNGEFGVVNRGMWKPSSNKQVEIAIKTLNTDSTAKDRLRFLQEAAIMCQFDHENVIKLYGVVTETPAMIVLEYMSRGDLKSILMQHRPLAVKPTHEKLSIVLLKFCQEIAAGMVYLSAKNFVHRDLAARNILVSESSTCKIADFGLSRNLLNDNYYVTSGGKIPMKWTAPEAMHYRKYSVYSDVWSYGCVLFEIWSLGHKPFGDMTSDETLQKVDSGYRLPPPPGCSRIIYRMMIKCWTPWDQLKVLIIKVS
ncbi:uncharacterized protein [Dysidea avara]|uniref:uncharacterized protein isoform X3 n=1 Tax=Dysidea avara TaxID=196820 RepID=UPI00332AEBF6